MYKRQVQDPGDIASLILPNQIVGANAPFLIPISLSNGTEVSGFQLTIEDSPDILESLLVESTDRTEGFNIYIDESNGDGRVTVIGFSFFGDQIESGDGPIISLTYNVEDSWSNGDTVNLNITDLILSNQSGNTIPSFSIDGLLTLSNEILGCTDFNACNYDADATYDDDSCLLL